MLCGEIIALYSEIRTKHVYIVEKSSVLNVKQMNAVVLNALQLFFPHYMQ
jgi:hypothetical protein